MKLFSHSTKLKLATEIVVKIASHKTIEYKTPTTLLTLYAIFTIGISANKISLPPNNIATNINDINKHNIKLAIILARPICFLFIYSLVFAIIKMFVKIFKHTYKILDIPLLKKLKVVPEIVLLTLKSFPLAKNIIKIVHINTSIVGNITLVVR